MALRLLRHASLLQVLLPLLLRQWQAAMAASRSGPVGTITAMSTQTRRYSSTVRITYMEPVNCTLQFDEDVVDFGVESFTAASDTRILNFEQVDSSRYEFQVASVVNANVSIYIAIGTVRNAGGHFNNETTAFFNFHFYAYPPSATLRLDGYEAQSTSKVTNLAYLVFNSTTQYDGIEHFNRNFVSMSPAFEIQNFQQASEDTYRFNFVILKNTTDEASSIECVFPENQTASTENQTTSIEHTIFRCLKCDRPKLCISRTRYPPEGLSNMEFPLEVVIEPIPMLGMNLTSLPLIYDTLWANVALDAPRFAKGPFFVTVTWTEPMSDLTAVQPSFGAIGPPVDQEALSQNLTILSPSSFRLLVVPTETGLLTITINGTQDSKDLAGNSNDFRRNPSSSTSSARVVVFSAGPPVAGRLAFAYQRPPALYEFEAAASLTSSPSVPSLMVSWAGFLTATRYQLWITWGRNQSVPLREAICGNSGITCPDSYIFTDFRALLGVEYTVYVRASNIWGDQITVTKVFLHPKLDVIADGTYKVLKMPDLLSQEETNVGFHVMVPDRGFLSMNPLKVLSFSTANRSAGDEDPCDSNSPLRRCTMLNFRIEVPATQFIVFREPIRLQFTFGREGWTDPYFRPQLRYWEVYQEEWREAASTCPPDQAYERWDNDYKIYSVSFCHLTQFAVFESFMPTSAPATDAPEPRPESYLDPVFFVALAGFVLVVMLICCAWYWACIRPSRAAAV